MQEFEASKEPLNLTNAFPALTGDIIMDYFFGFNYAQLKSPEFDSFHEAFVKLGSTGHIATQFPWFLPVMNRIPDSITEWLEPAAAPMLKFKRVSLMLFSFEQESSSLSNHNTAITYQFQSKKLNPPGPTHPHRPHPLGRIHQIQRRQNDHFPRNPLFPPPRLRQDARPPG
jgi:hypothetical protein